MEKVNRDVGEVGKRRDLHFFDTDLSMNGLVEIIKRFLDQIILAMIGNDENSR